MRAALGALWLAACSPPELTEVVAPGLFVLAPVYGRLAARRIRPSRA